VSLQTPPMAGAGVGSIQLYSELFGLSKVRAGRRRLEKASDRESDADDPPCSYPDGPGSNAAALFGRLEFFGGHRRISWDAPSPGVMDPAHVN